MAVSPYRFSVSEPTRDMRTRTGLAGVTTGATSGGEGFRASALRPGSSGYMAAGFGAPPRSDYVKPVAPTPEPAPAPVPEAPALAPAPPPTGEALFEVRQGGMAEGSGPNGGEGGLAAEPSQPTSGWLADLMANVGLTNPGYDASSSGPVVVGEDGGYENGFSNTGTGNYSTGPRYAGPASLSTAGFLGADESGADGMASGGELGDLGAQAEANVENMGGATGVEQSAGDFGDARGLAQGGYVGPENMAGAEKYMGAYSQGGQVPNYAEGGMVDEAGLAGPNPPGPDDGFAALDGGEYVVQAQQAQRPDYAPILQAMNAGAYQPGMDDDDGEEGMSMPGMTTAEGHTTGDPGALPPDMQRALMAAMQSDPALAAALAQLLGPDAAHSLVDSTDEGSPAPMDTGRPPLAGPPPIPGAHAPMGVRPPAAAMPTQPMPPMMPPRPPGGAGLAGVMA